MIQVLGISGQIPLLLTWNANNLGGHLNRAVGLAMQVSFGGIGGIIAAYSFRTPDAPRFILGFIILTAFEVLTIVLGVVYLIGVVWENRARDAGKRDHLRNLPEDEELGDAHVTPSTILLM
jgi:hypothetical protein